MIFYIELDRRFKSRSDEVRALQNAIFCLISALCSNFNPQNIKYILCVKIFAHLKIEQNLTFCKALIIFLRTAKEK